MATKGLVMMLGGLTAVLGAYVSCELFHLTTTKATAFEHAKQLANGKGIINLGAGPHRTCQAQVIACQPEVLTNIDIAPDGMPQFIQLDIEREVLPFADKQFGAAFLSHVLEHLNNWQFAVEEASRVADYVVIVLPHPAYFSGQFWPEHKQHFSRDDIQRMVDLYPNVEVYY